VADPRWVDGLLPDVKIRVEQIVARPWPEEKRDMLELIRIAEIKTVAEGGDAGWGWW
jgi:hypothetical protein